MTTIHDNVTHVGNNSESFGDNSTDTDVTVGIVFWMIFYVITMVIAAVLSLVTCVFALISWIMIPKWRTFKNYVFVNLILSYTLSYTFFFTKIFDITNDYVYIFVCSFSCWLFIGSIVFYMDIVKVFSVEVTRKKIKSTIFAWGAPLLNYLLNVIDKELFRISEMFSSNKNSFYFVLLMLFCNFLIYLRVLYSLFRVSGLRSTSRTRIKQKVQVATFTFLMSGSMTLPALLVEEFGVTLYSAIVSGTIPFIQTIAISTCFLMLKSNRTMWRELCCKKIEMGR